MSWKQHLQFGAESTAGTAVAASTILRANGGALESMNDPEFVEEQTGLAVPTSRSYIPKVGGNLSIAAHQASFEQLPYFFEGGVKKVTPAADGSGSSGYIRDYEVGLTAINTIQPYTIEGDDAAGAEEMEYGVCSGFTLSGNYGESVMIASEWFGRQVTPTTLTPALAVPSVETILAGKGSFAIDNSGGSFGGTAVSNFIKSFTLTVVTGWRPDHTIDTGELYFGEAVYSKELASFELDIVMKYNSDAVAEKALWKSETVRLLQMVFEGSDYATAGSGTTYSKKTQVINMAGKWAKFEPIGSDDGVSVVSAKFKGGYDATNAALLQLINANELATLP